MCKWNRVSFYDAQTSANNTGYYTESCETEQLNIAQIFCGSDDVEKMLFLINVGKCTHWGFLTETYQIFV